MKMLGVIPARGGSKRLPGKNMRVLAGKPLVRWAIDAGQEAGLDCVVTSDSEEILAHTWIDSPNLCHALRRPAALANDAARMEDVVMHVLYHIKGYDAICLLQPTSPLRTAQDIQRALAFFNDESANTLISVSEGNSRPNGAIYMARVPWFQKNERFVDADTVLFSMPPERSVDIDHLRDFERADAYISGNYCTKGYGDWSAPTVSA